MTNPYRPPEADFSNPEGATADLKVFSLNGRIGRLRYLAYSFGFAVVALVVGMLVGGLGVAILPGSLAAVAPLLGVVLMFFGAIVAARRRLHDLGHTAWLAGLLVVPFVNFFVGLWLVFARGDDGANAYGLPPPPNSRGVIALATILPAVYIIGMLASVAIPAYSDYAQRARGVSSQSF